MGKVVVGLFTNYKYADDAAKNINRAGFSTNDVFILSKEYSSNLPSSPELPDESELYGTSAGNAAGSLLGLNSVIIPGSASVATSGPISRSMVGFSFEDSSGGLINVGSTSKYGQKYEEPLKEGYTVLGIKCDKKNINEIKNILLENNAMNVETH